MDFAGYTDAQLQDLRRYIDPVRFPTNFQKLEAELSRRAKDGRGKRCVVHFTSTGGFPGWLQAFFALQPFYGTGSITAGSDQVLLEGWQRTWLGTGQQSEMAIPSDRILNVYCDHEWISFDVRRRLFWPRHYMMRADSGAEASAFTRSLPASRSKWFEKQATDLRDFYRLLRAPGRQPWVTAFVVLACLGVYVIQAAISGYWVALDGVTLTEWGINIGPQTVHGAWWRLPASIFLHLNLVHLAVNMWVLWSAGRLAERLFGNLVYAVIYLVAGLVGGLLSIAWNPAVVTAGASGAIFGVLGALIAYLVHGGTRVPRRILRAHLIPTLLFTLFSILNGLAQAGIDNAAHVGGLVAGLLLGWAFAIPFSRQSGGLAVAQGVASLALVIAGVAGLLFQVTGPASRSSVAEQFLSANEWYRSGEERNIQRWQELANRAGAGNIASGDFARQFETDIVPFWRDAGRKLRAQLPATPSGNRGFAAAVTDFAGLRLRWARAVIESARTNNAEAALDLMEKTDVAQARLDWFGLRGRYDHQAYALGEKRPIAEVENVAWLNYRPCVKSPFKDFNAVSPSDMSADGPARAAALACQAQHLFLTRDFVSLEKLLEDARRHPHDLMDGSSSYDAAFGGLDRLFQYGGLSADAALVRLADWRLAAPGSVQADLTEVSVLVAWAYQARGLGTADTITAQNQTIFLHRIKIANAALTAMEARGRNHAEWYAQAIDVNLLGNGKEEERRAIFQKAHALFPDDIALDGAMLHALMPRWGGSFEKVAQFIADQSQEEHTMPGPEKYARLYWDYLDLEGSDTDVFKDAYAKPDIVSLGQAMMMKRYPRSDYVANVAGRLACQSGQKLEYLVFHSQMPKRYSASAWSPNLTVEGCDRVFKLTPGRA